MVRAIPEKPSGTMMETTEDWMRRIGSKEAMEERQGLRASRKLNKPLPPGRPSSPFSTVGHRWECECSLCRPWLWQDEEKIDIDKNKLTGNWHEKLPQLPQEPKPAVVIPATPEPNKKKRKWTGQRGRSSN